MEPPPHAEVASNAHEMTIIARRLRRRPVFRNDMGNAPNSRAKAAALAIPKRLSDRFCDVVAGLTVNVTFCGLLPVKETVAGLLTHCIPAGAPVQLAVSVPLNPPAGVTAS